MSPETVQMKAWRDVLSCTLVKERLVCVAIDEAHCIAEWFVTLEFQRITDRYN